MMYEKEEGSIKSKALEHIIQGLDELIADRINGSQESEEGMEESSEMLMEKPEMSEESPLDAMGEGEPEAEAEIKAISIEKPVSKEEVKETFSPMLSKKKPSLFGK